MKSELQDSLSAFVDYARSLSDEKGEAQVFCDRLFKAFGHEGYKEAGATLEYRIPKRGGKGRKFADLMWKPRVLIEMKSAGEKLHLHYQQAFDYWIAAVPNRPRYVVLCNFRDFWIYDFDKQLSEPVDKVALEDLPRRYPAMNFMLPHDPKPVFGNDREKVSREAADKMAELFRGLVKRPGRPVPREQAQRFVLQLLVAMFAEDIGLLPPATIHGIYQDCVERGQSAYDLFGSLFRQMNDPRPADGGRFRGVRYFNGGLFGKVEPIELDSYQLDLIAAPGERGGAASKDWSKVDPAIFGTLFQDSMDATQRHALGAHYTAEADIQRIVGPTIVRPWSARIEAARTLKQLLDLRRELSEFQVLDPACGSGNFLYVAFRELSRLDLRILHRVKEDFSEAEFLRQATTLSAVSPRQFHGIELDGFGVELAKVTLMLAKKLALDEARATFGALQHDLGFEEDGLPLDNLDDNVRQGDALLIAWPRVHAIVGNPPYQSKNKLQAETAAGYSQELRRVHPQVDGRADYCCYWFRLAQDRLPAGGRAGLVGTNTIRQNYSREASLDHIVADGGTIVEAVSSMPWPGEAALHVSIVNWVKGDQPGAKRLFIQEGSKGKVVERMQEFERIGPSLSFGHDVTGAGVIAANSASGCHQGQTHGHKGFLLKVDSAKLALAEDGSGALAEVLKPYMIANDLIARKVPQPGRYVIDFTGKDVIEAEEHALPFRRLKDAVLPTRMKAATTEEKRNAAALLKNPKYRTNRHHSNFLKSWWRMSYPREDMLTDLEGLSRYIVCGRVTKRPIFAFIDRGIRPGDALQVFAFEDDYSFGILQSGLHWTWFTNRCSTLTERFRYTSNTVWDTFPWPQRPSLAAVKRVAAAAVQLRATRSDLMAKHNRSLRELYRVLDAPGRSGLHEAHADLDAAVRLAYGLSAKAEPLEALLRLNAAVVDAERSGGDVQAPGLPSMINDKSAFITADRITA